MAYTDRDKQREYQRQRPSPPPVRPCPYCAPDELCALCLSLRSHEMHTWAEAHPCECEALCECDNHVHD